MNTKAIEESEMATDILTLLKELGIKNGHRIDICCGIGREIPGASYKNMLPLYLKSRPSCKTNQARQIARPDLIVIDTQLKVVDLIIEFEYDTNPKNLIGNYFSVFMAEEYKPRNEKATYNLDASRTTHFLLTCLNKRGIKPKEQAAIEKGKAVAEWLELASGLLTGMAQFSKIKKAHALAGDDWQQMKTYFAKLVKEACPQMF
ncbi:MAG: hypothetical protein JO295_08695 [Verrucomicrobia bacterium]|nr:hypothetical protein [Verrucomicrobiota bacterium]